MLRLLSGGHLRDSDRITRREFVQVGSLGLGGLSLTNLLAAQALAREADGVVKDKSIVLHWPKLSTLVFAGGGLKMGQTVGRSTRHADEPLANPITPENLMATVVHTMFDVPALRLLPNIPRDLARLIEAGRPIVELGLDT